MRDTANVLSSIVVCGILFLSTVPNVASYPVGMVAYWKFDEGLNDKLGVYDATFGPSGSFTGGMIGQGLLCGQACSSQIAARVDNFPNLDSFTVEAWIKPACPPGSWQTSLSVAKWADSYGGHGFILYTYPVPYGSSVYRFGWNINDGVAGKQLESTLTYSCGNWYHVAGMRDKGNSLTFFLNGLELANVVDDIGSTANSQPLTFHGALDSSCDWGMSQITLDEVAIYDRPLSAAEIQQHYQNGLQGRGYDETTSVTIDIKPGSTPNSVNLKDRGLLPVAILGSTTFDVKNIDPATIQLGGVGVTMRGSAKAPKLAYSYEDVNGDGYLDLMVLFSVQQLVTAEALAHTTTSLKLTANLNDGTAIVGTDSVNVVPP